MERKVALVGCKRSEWIRTRGMNPLRLNAKIHQDAMIQVLQHDGRDAVSKTFVGSGLHKLDPSDWVQVAIVDGSFSGALCILEGAA